MEEFISVVQREKFKKYFSKQIANEVEKNIQRLTSDITDIINKETDKNTEHTLKYILNELDTIEKVLSGEQNKSIEYERAIINLKNKINSIDIQSNRN